MGYQSDTGLNGENFVGDFPLQNNVGNYGEAQGANDYILALDPPITSLREGMEFLVLFINTNSTSATLDIDNTTPKRIVKRIRDQKIQLEIGDLIPSRIYRLVWDGVDYIITGVVIESKEDSLGDPTQNGQVLFSTSTGIRTWADVSRTLFNSYETLGEIGDGSEQVIGTTSELPVGVLKNEDSIEMLISGIATGIGVKRLRIKIGGVTLMEHVIIGEVRFSIKITCGIVNTILLRGVAVLDFTGLPSEVINIESVSPNLLTTSQLIEFTNETSTDSFLARYMFLIRYLS